MLPIEQALEITKIRDYTMGSISIFKITKNWVHIKVVERIVLSYKENRRIRNSRLSP